MHCMTSLAGLVLALSTVGSQAASIYPVHTGNNETAGDGAILVAPGDTVTFDIVMDFSAPGEAVVGGGFDISFDADLLRLAAFQNVYLCGSLHCDFFPEPLLLDGVLQGIFVADFYGITGPALVGTIAFEWLGTSMSGDTLIQLGPDSGPYDGDFISAVDFVSAVDVDFGIATLRPVPLPAPAWLLASALGALVRYRRK